MKKMDKNYSGLTDAEIIEKEQLGQVNKVETNLSKSRKAIIFSHLFTFFNIINVVLFVILILVGSYKNTLFIFINVANSIIGIVQELKAKRILDNLSILTTARVTVIRNSSKVEIAVEKLVLDDLIILSTGDQIPADSMIIDGHLEVNEALLTGEADTIVKNIDDELFSGSFITAGNAVCRVIHVGEDNYVQQITKEAKVFKPHQSQLDVSLNLILKIVSVLILPLAGLLFWKQLNSEAVTFKDSVVSTVASILGMIPEGLMLQTSVALAVSVMTLAKKNTLVQELYCVETLSRVDTLCLDKTGTITEGRMVVDEIVPLDTVNIDEIMGNMMMHLTDQNATALALNERFEKMDTFILQQAIPFSSDRKFSGVSFKEQGTYLIGATQFLFPNHMNPSLEKQVVTYSAKGYRVLVLAHCDTFAEQAVHQKNLKPLGLVIISDVIREDVKETLQFFKKQSVECKVISGDDPSTVSHIAQEAGIIGAERFIDATTITTHEEMLEAMQSFQVFGRVTPKQKKEMVLCLKELGKTVAMTGDGVNDVLAFKEADVSIAMADGSDAAKQAANVVLLDNNFDALPDIFNEGRRVINNVTKSASMFLIKTVFSIVITILTILIGQAYPFEPIQLSLIGAWCVGIPSFLLTYESDFNQPPKNFIHTVFRNAIPPALVISFGTTLIMNLGGQFDVSKPMLTTISVIFTAWNYMIALKSIYTPFTGYRKLVLYGTQALYFMTLLIGPKTLGMAGLNYPALVFLIFLLAMIPIIHDISLWIYNHVNQLLLKFPFIEKWVQSK